MRRPLMFLLTLGVIFGFGSGFAQLHRWRHGCHDWRDGRWSDTRGGGYDWRDARDVQPEVKAPQTVVVQPSAPAAAPAPQVFVIMPPGVATPQVVTVPVAATPASANVAPPATAP